MGQKVNSNALRLYRNKNWSTQSFIDSSNYDKILVQDLFIQDYIKSVLFRYNIFCTNVVIKRLDNLVHIYIYFYNDKLFSLLRPKGSRSVISHKKFITSKDYRFLNFIRFKQSSQKKLFLNYILKKTIKGVPFKKFSELEGLCTKKEFKDFVRKSYFEFQNVWKKNKKLKNSINKPNSILKAFNKKVYSKDYRFKNHAKLKKSFLKNSSGIDHYNAKKVFYNNRMFFDNSLKKIIYSNLSLILPNSNIFLHSHNTFHVNRKMVNILKRRLFKYRLPLNQKHGLMFLLCLWTALLYKSSNLICQYLSLIFKLYIKRCFKFLNALKVVIGSFFWKCNLKGIKILFKGCLNDRRRSRSFSILKGRIPTQTLDARISFSQIDCLTIYGVCGIKVWIYY